MPKNMSQPDFTGLREQLLRGGVAQRHVDRTIAELSDHYSDLKSEAVARGLDDTAAAREATTRLGRQEDLVAGVLARPELRSWASRWPWLVYGIMPALSLIGAVILVTFSLAAFVKAGTYMAGTKFIPPYWVQTLVDTGLAGVKYVGPLLLAAIFAVFAVQRRSQVFWPLIGLAGLCILGGSFSVSVVWPATVEDMGALNVSTFPAVGLTEATARSALNLIVVLGAFLWWRTHRLEAL